MSLHMQMLVDGNWVGEGELPVFNPYNGELVGTVPRADAGAVAACVEAAARYQSPLTAWDRYQILKNSAEELWSRKEELSELISREAGVALRWSRKEVERAYLTLTFSAEEARRLYGETLPADVIPGVSQRLAITLKEPVGVVAAITPFNHPLNQVVHKVGPALAANNRVILKPSEKTPLSAIRLGEILLRNGLPAPMLSILTGEGSSTGRALVSHPLVDLVSFTGSVEVGEEITRRAGIKKLCLELGGNDPLLILEDADLELAVRLAVEGAFSNSGQRCTSIKRILVQSRRAEEFVERFTEATQALKWGDPMDPETDVGCLIDEEAAERVEARVRKAVEEGAVLCCGGRRRGALLQPTVLDRVSPESEIVRLETFGPTAPVIRFEEDSQALEIINSTQYGLQAGIVTRDWERALALARRMRVGGVMINQGPGFRVESFPFGGVKKSGYGKEGVRFAVEAMSHTKLILL